ncbi:MAG: hypothetical protein COW84_03665 [Gammaproteobacteria bacterium CG22_combo_CG10-13_8_21_14_all_40_8]|nr:MAG: hypothetical protein COW84_03665 [Gammaproteobacteria bacterium CG22_combo_CG10-13_8_21_14_all_40_8]
MTMFLRLLSIIGIFTLFSCASAIPDVINQPIQQPVLLSQVQQDIQSYQGTSIRWGGIIAKVENKANETWIEIVAKNLDFKARPEEDDATSGRFIIKINEFVDPLIYEQKREVTVYGQISGVIEGKIGEHAYQFPVVEVLGHHLWPIRKPKSQRDLFIPVSYWGPMYYYPYIH